MKAIVLLAGLGTRLRPHTYSKPKPLVNVAGNTVLGHILDSMSGVQFDEVVFVVGYMGDLIEQYVSRAYPQLQVSFVEQKEMKGQAHAIALARAHIDQPVLVVFGDTIWETDWSRLDRVDGDGLIYVHPVADPRRYGVVTLDDRGRVTRFVEKPQTPISHLAVIGVYYFRNWSLLLQGLDDLMAHNLQLNGEFYLADAMQCMLDRGAQLEAETISVWEDCGTRDALLQTNRYLLTRQAPPVPLFPEALIIPPVSIAPDARICRSIVGPYVSIAQGAVIEDSILQDCIVSENAHISQVTLQSSLVGRDARVQGNYQSLNVGDSSQVDFSARNDD